MSPVIFYSAVALGFVGKLLFPRSMVLVVLVAAGALPIAATIYFGEISLLGLVLVTPVTLAGAVLGLLTAVLARELWTSRHSKS
jgi:hypothetical protein